MCSLSIGPCLTLFYINSLLSFMAQLPECHNGSLTMVVTNKLLSSVLVCKKILNNFNDYFDPQKKNFTQKISSKIFQTIISRYTVPTVCIKKTCPNLCEEYSSCGQYKFTYKHCIRPHAHYQWFVYSQRTKSSQSLVRGAAIVEAWVY